MSGDTSTENGRGPQGPFELRLRLIDAGYVPVALNGKIPVLDKWQKETGDRDNVKTWRRDFPFARGTGIVTRTVPSLDIDIKIAEAAVAVEELVRQRFADAGVFLVRIGQPPKRAIPFRTDTPFKKIVVPLIAPDGSEGQKLELLSDGQQLACFGIHPDTRKPYTWLGGEPGAIKRQDLPLITEAEARQLVNDAVEILCRDFGYRLAPKRPDRTVNDGPGAADWSFLMENIRLGRDLHDSTRDLAAKLVVAGLNGGVAVNVLRAVMDQSKAKQDTPKRWQERYDEIPRLVTSAEEKFAPGPDMVNFLNNTKKNQQVGVALQTTKHGEAVVEPVRWCVRYRLPRTGAGLLLGQWGMFKTYWALDLTAHLILGWDWLGEPVYRQCGVLAFAPEGGDSIAPRFAALLEHKIKERLDADNLFDPAFPPLTIDIDKMPFEWVNKCPMLLGKANPLPTMIATARAAHERFMQEFNLPLGLIWIDTMSTSAGWKSEDDNADAARAMAILRELSATVNAVVMGIDHFGKNSDAGARGASAKEANSDFLFAALGERELSGEVRNSRLAIRKLRDGPQGIEFSFTPRVVETGADERSNPITSVVIDWSSTAAPIRSSGGVGWSTPTLKKLRQVLLATLAEHGQSVPAALNGSPVLGVDQEIIRREFYSACTEEKPETRQRTFRRVITNALERELIRQCDFEGTTFLWFKNAIEQPEAVVANFLRHGSVGGEPINGFGSTKGSA